MEIEQLLLAMEDRINKRFDEMEKGFNKKFDEMDKRFDAIEKRLDTIEEKVDNIDLKLDQLEAKNAIRHMEIQHDINNINIVNAKNNYELAQLKKVK